MDQCCRMDWGVQRGRGTTTNVLLGLLLVAAVCLMVLEVRRPAAGMVVLENWAARYKMREPLQDEVDPRLSWAALHEAVVSFQPAGSGDGEWSNRWRGGEVRVQLQAHGVASHLFVQVGCYRVGARGFAVVGLVAQHLYQLHDLAFHCDWQSHRRNATLVKGMASKIRPDFRYHRLYGTLVIICDFDHDLGGEEGGSLWINASYGDAFRPDERFLALRETPGACNTSAFHPPFPYDYVYCGSPLFGNLSPQRVREWMAYHNHFFGENVHFILYDAGGIHDEVYEILRPWVEVGKVSIQNVRQADIYDGYYHHQFAVVNDCMFRAQTLANWTFFFDLDEYLYLQPPTLLAHLLETSKRQNATQIQFQQIRLASGTCLLEDDHHNNGSLQATTSTAQKWMMEKLVFSMQWKGSVIRDMKYAIQSRECWGATGVHKCEVLKDGGNTQLMDATTELRFYHYHDTLATRGEVCESFALAHLHLPPHYLVIGKDNYSTDTTMVSMANSAKQYELHTIGPQPFIL